MTRYTTISNGNNQCARPRALKPHKEMKKQAGQATPAFTFPFKATTCDCRLYIGNLRHICHGGKGNDFLFSNSHAMADVSNFNGGRSLRCPKDRVFFFIGIKEENGTGDCGWENGFRLLATEHTQTPNTNCDGSVRTSSDDRKMPDVFKHAVFKERCAKR